MTRSESAIRFLVHGRVELALHALRDSSEGHALLLLHGLGECTPARVPAAVESWPGSVYGLDFVGHGRSTVPRGGGYTAEVLLGDTDTALRELGEATLLGRGLGAYLALLAAGGRADVVRGAILADGPGLVGGGTRPGSSVVLRVGAGEPPGPPDPYALAELSRDVRPPDYAAAWVRHAVEYSPFDTPIAVTAVSRPEWVQAVLGEPGVADVTLGEALDLYR